jgi:hypothetical protein
MSDARIKRYRRLCKEAAKQLGVKPTHERALHCAVLRLARETFAARLVEGRDVSPDALIKLDLALREFMPAHSALSVPKVTVEIVDHQIGRCPACGHTSDALQPPPKPQGPARTIDLEPEQNRSKTERNRSPAPQPSRRSNPITTSFTLADPSSELASTAGSIRISESTKRRTRSLVLRDDPSWESEERHD